MEYRIKELSGSFVIEVKILEIGGAWWWKQEMYVWVRCNSRGNVCNTHVADEPPCKSFASLDAAKKQVEIFKYPPLPIYHTCDN